MSAGSFAENSGETAGCMTPSIAVFTWDYSTAGGGVSLDEDHR